MAIKYNDGKIRLWKSKKEERPGIGIKFEIDCANKEIKEIFEVIRSILTFKYGEGIE